MTNVIVILETVAKQLGKRTKACNSFDSNVCKVTVDNKWQPVATSGFPFTRELWADFAQRRINLQANPEFLRCEVQGKLVTRSYSIGRPGFSFAREPGAWLKIGESRWPVFTSARTEELRPSLVDPALKRAVGELLHDNSESLHFFEGAVVLYYVPRTTASVLAAISILANLVGTAESELDSVDLSVLPPQFHDLIPYIRRWAISDDGERSELTDEALKTELEELVTAVKPRLPEIDKYLDSFGQKGPSEMAALALQTLGECCVEVQLKLKADR